MTIVPENILANWQVVVIDDEEDSLQVASYILEYYQATVYTAMNGEEGLKLIREVQPRFVISDLSMPIMDGWDLIEALKKDLAVQDIPCIALTAHAMIGDRERAIAGGFHNYLTKPLTPKTFIQDLLNLLVDIPELAKDLVY